MSSSRTNSFRRASMDHFEPEVNDDPHAQRRLRGQLEQIDYTAFASNREVIAQGLGDVDAAKFQRLAVAAALARTRWVSQALAMSSPQGLSAEQVARLLICAALMRNSPKPMKPCAAWWSAAT